MAVWYINSQKLSFSGLLWNRARHRVSGNRQHFQTRAFGGSPTRFGYGHPVAKVGRSSRTGRRDGDAHYEQPQMPVRSELYPGAATVHVARAGLLESPAWATEQKILLFTAASPPKAESLHGDATGQVAIVTLAPALVPHLMDPTLPAGPFALTVYVPGGQPIPASSVASVQGIVFALPVVALEQRTSAFAVSMSAMASKDASTRFDPPLASLTNAVEPRTIIPRTARTASPGARAFPQ